MSIFPWCLTAKIFFTSIVRARSHDKNLPAGLALGREVLLFGAKVLLESVSLGISSMEQVV